MAGRSLGWIGRIGLLTVVVAGCQSQTLPPPTPSRSPSPSPSASSEPTGARSLAPESTASPSASPLLTVPPVVFQDPALSCGDETVTFAPATLSGAPGAESGPDAAAAALRAFLQLPHEPDDFPDTGWWRVHETPDTVLFMAAGPAHMPWLQVGFGERGGRWELDVAGQCQLQLALPGDVVAGNWWLDPKFPFPTPEDKLIHALVQERACAGGQDPRERIIEPVVFYARLEITIIVPIWELPGGADCTGNMAVSWLIRLAEPVGDRRLLDGATQPPRDASRPPD